MSSHRKYAVIVAGGSGQRMLSAIPKQFLILDGKPILWHSISLFLHAFPDLRAIVVVPEAHMERSVGIVADCPDPGRVKLTVRGSTRFQSVKNGLALVDAPGVIFVHDAVRCLASISLIHHCYNSAVEMGNAIPATYSTDSIRLETPDGNQPLDRNRVRIIQTPQTFLSSQLLPAFESDYHPSFTDEASVVEHYGEKIHLIPGEATNIKITLPADLLLAGQILLARK